jgi:cell fate (sporulation/competence/biofilm development) regulator YlbF (YheA/YmcA/DUF963 family)
MNSDGSDGSAEVMKCAQAFVDALKNTPLVHHYSAAERQFRTDPGVQKFLAALREKARAFQRSQEEGTLRQEHIQELREMQAQFQAHPFVQNFQDARQSVGLLFQETNAIMSKILGIDFGQTAGPAGGAC